MQKQQINQLEEKIQSLQDLLEAAANKPESDDKADPLEIRTAVPATQLPPLET